MPTNDMWKNAPDWANWKAQDKDGYWYWYGDKPIISDLHNVWDIEKPETFLVTNAGRAEPNSDWRNAIFQRPANQ